MARIAKRHRCIDCGATTPRWAGKCPGCGEWNTLVAEAQLSSLASAVDELSLSVQPLPLSSVDGTHLGPVPTGLAEFDSVLSGGLVPGSITMVGGEPGIGKSTLLLQVLASRASAGARVLLVSSEESAHQVRLRAERLGPVPADLLVLPVTEVGDVIDVVAETRPDLVVVDSVQALAVGPRGPRERMTAGTPGSATQVRACAGFLAGMAKSHNVATVLVGHVTKDGSLAGPRSLEHLVDTVLSFEGDRHHALRLLRTVKHRFGPTGELGLFQMGEQGLEPVDDPGMLLLGDRLTGVPGDVVLPAVQGQRTLLVELQALVTKAGSAHPRRTAVGLDGGRLVMAMAVLNEHVGLPVLGMDVFASVAGGVRVSEPAADLAIALSVASAVTRAPLAADVAAVGEVGLSGEIRQVTHLGRRLEECARLGFTKVVVPASAPLDPSGVELIRAATVADAVRHRGCWAPC